MNLFTCPFYFSTNPDKLVKFYELIGLQTVTTSETNGQIDYAFMKASSGYLAIHGTPAAMGKPGETHLVFVADGYDNLKQEMNNCGIVIEQWDEAWGQQSGILDPDGAGIWINTINHDLYGYQKHEITDSKHHVEIVMVKYSKDFTQDRDFFAKLGFTSLPDANEWWEQLRRTRFSGSIGLHRSETDKLSYREEPNNYLGGRVPLATISFQTSQDLPQLAQLLTDAGYLAKVVNDTTITKLNVIDPEGKHLEIHPLT